MHGEVALHIAAIGNVACQLWRRSLEDKECEVSALGLMNLYPTHKNNCANRAKGMQTQQVYTVQRYQKGRPTHVNFSQMPLESCQMVTNRAQIAIVTCALAADAFDVGCMYGIQES